MDVVNDVVVSDVNEMVAQMHRDVSDDISNAQTNAEAGQMPSLNEYRDERTESKALELDRHQLFVDSWRTLFNIIEEHYLLRRAGQAAYNVVARRSVSASGEVRPSGPGPGTVAIVGVKMPRNNAAVARSKPVARKRGRN